MKKIVIVAVLAASTCAFAAELTPAEKAIAWAQKYAANVATNATDAGVWLIPEMTNDMAVAAQVDDILCVLPVPPKGRKELMKPYFPKTWNAHIAHLRTTHPVLAAHFAGEQPNVSSSLERFASFWFELVDVSKGTMPEHLPKIIDYTLKAAKPAVVRKLRAEGVRPLSSNGVVRVQQELDSVAACLNAPRFAGLSERLQYYGVNIHVIDFSYVPSGAELTALTNAIFNYDVKFDALNQAMLRYALGLEAYNAFVDKYNE